ncbi:hypothetical protein PAHAL_2G261900 [Panicum hallii]|uniref:Uncharacterized protein n=1 Tax=Panicum hallii TaxID=206008 RepID=A0A2T8KQH1_9POAL|nr:hypothetical protein PAHAL_2G261900 [Panicum hallii]
MAAIYTADGAFPNPRPAPPTSSVAAAPSPTFSSALLLFAPARVEQRLWFSFPPLDVSLDFSPHLAFRLILFLGDLDGNRWEQVMRTRQGHQNPLLGMID